MAKLMRATSGMIKAHDVMEVLGVERAHAGKLLAGWHQQGVVRRIARGVYIPIQPSALGQKQVLDDPWILVPELYNPAYVGGWSALEHWDLTEQLFRSVCVLTTKRTAYGDTENQGVGFFVKHISQNKFFGTRSIWRDHVKLGISDPYKTVLDIIDDPYLGAGMKHSMDSLVEFKKIYAKQNGFEKLLNYAIQINNGALFKKLGFLSEHLSLSKKLTEACYNRITTGYAYLDKNVKENSLITRWRLWAPRGYDF